jgi:hypothetical protein
MFERRKGQSPELSGMELSIIKSKLRIAIQIKVIKKQSYKCEEYVISHSLLVSLVLALTMSRANHLIYGQSD